MAKPDAALFDLIEGRQRDVGSAVVDSAIEHRVLGLVWSSVDRMGIALSSEDQRRLALLDLAEVASHHR
jgi:hypothetical protein